MFPALQRFRASEMSTRRRAWGPVLVEEGFMSSGIRYEKKSSVAVFTIDNPPVNAWTPAMHKAFYDRLVEFIDDDSVRVGILTGAGERCFSAGDDIKTPRPPRTHAELNRRYLEGMKEDTELDFPGWEHKVLTLTRYKPIIGAINGTALGGGFLYLQLLTDIRIAVRGAQLGLPEIKYGMSGAGGALQLGNAISHVDAMYLLLTGSVIDADRACEMRLVNEVVEPGDLMGRAFEIAEMIAAHDPLAIKVEMESYYRGRDLPRDQALALSGFMFRMIRSTFPEKPPLEDEK